MANYQAIDSEDPWLRNKKLQLKMYNAMPSMHLWFFAKIFGNFVFMKLKAKMAMKIQIVHNLFMSLRGARVNQKN